MQLRPQHFGVIIIIIIFFLAITFSEKKKNHSDKSSIRVHKLKKMNFKAGIRKLPLGISQLLIQKSGNVI